MSTSPRAGHLSRRTSHGPAVLGGALLALALIAGACTPSHRHAAASTTSSIPAATTTTQLPPQYAPSPYSWDRAKSPTLAVGGGASATLSAVVAPQLTGSWFVFGSRLSPTGIPSATVWTSRDALTWSGVPLGSGPGQATAAAQYRVTTVAVGSTGEGARQQAAVWLSPDADTPFTAQSVPSSDGPSVMTDVTAGALGMFATGTVDGRFAMWSSTSGRRWSELPGAEKVIGNSPGARVNTLLAEGDYVYAAGSIQPGATPQAALWATADGINWHLVNSAAPSFSGPEGRIIYSLAPLGTGLVAVGAVVNGSTWTPASWISPDGQSWSLPSLAFPAVPHPASGVLDLGPSGGSAARSVSAIPTLAGSNSVVAAGGGPYGQAAWRSSDGLHWSSLSLPAADAAATSWRAEVTGATGDTTVVLDAEPGQPYLLTRTSARGGPGAPGGASAGTGSWTQPSSDPGVFGPVRSQAVPVSLKSAGGHLELTVAVVNRPQTVGAATVTPVMLSSADGSTWTASPSGPGGSAGSPATVPVAGATTARLPGLWVAVSGGSRLDGPTGLPPEVWTSPSGSAWKKTATLSLPSASSGGPAATASGAPAVSVNGVCSARVATTGASGSVTTTTPLAAPRYVVAAVGSAATASTAVMSGPTGLSSTATVTTRSATAWSSPTGSSWRSSPVGGGPPTGGTSSMSGCVTAGSGLAAYGTATAAGGVPVPALWRSTDGSSWSRTAVSAFAAGTPSPLVSLAVDGDYWVAAANPDPTADPFSTTDVAAAGPAASAGLDAGVGPSASLEDGRDGLWLSSDGGSTWQIIDTAAAPWLGAQQAAIDLVAFAAGSPVHAASSTTSTTPSSTSLRGRSATSTTSGGGGGGAGAAGSVPVVVGVVDGQLAVWTGTAVAAGT